MMCLDTKTMTQYLARLDRVNISHGNFKTVSNGFQCEFSDEFFSANVQTVGEFDINPN